MAAACRQRKHGLDSLNATVLEEWRARASEEEGGIETLEVVAIKAKYLSWTRTRPEGAEWRRTVLRLSESLAFSTGGLSPRTDDSISLLS